MCASSAQQVAQLDRVSLMYSSLASVLSKGSDVMACGLVNVWYTVQALSFISSADGIHVCGHPLHLCAPAFDTSLRVTVHVANTHHWHSLFLADALSSQLSWLWLQ